MITVEEFIKLAESTMTTINRFNEVIENAEMALGGCFENIYNTNIITELIKCLSATIGDKHGVINWVITERKGLFPIRSSIWLNYEPVSLESWAGVYSLVQEQKRFDGYVNPEEEII